MKKFFALFTAAVMAISLCGCSQKQPTAEEYAEEMRVWFKNYTSQSMDLSDVLREATSYTEEDVDRETKEILSAIDDFKKITPPEKYMEQHKNLYPPLDKEYKFQQTTGELCKYYIKGAENLTLAETAEVARLTAEMEKYFEESNDFFSGYRVLIKSVASDVEAEKEARQQEAMEAYGD